MTSPLESRYQRLLRIYPPAFRRTHGEDMLTTMLADAGDRQRWPRPGDAADIALHAVRQRLFTRSGRPLGAAWADACALIGLLAAVALVTIRFGLRPAIPDLSARFLRGLLWTAVVVAALTGWRRVAAGAAWAALLLETVPLAGRFGTDPVPSLYSLWLPVLALVCAVTLTAAGRTSPWKVAGRRRLTTILAAFAVIGTLLAVSAAGAFTSDSTDTGGSTWVFFASDLPGINVPIDDPMLFQASDEIVLDLMLLGTAIALLTLLIAVARLPGPIRRRLLVAASPVVTMIVLTNLGFAGWAASTGNMGHTIPLVPGQVVALVLLPLTVFLLGAWWVRRRDETMRLAELGARQERNPR
ncbi:hypothetical protein Dvina_16495 [Dactylosporangium vinaceum]|uniref:Integral membrane protein n=1 Tax=Dactylosporangium vinaceum TaxID=53362 RepID=A0ABV5M8W5_9ACTN|nr:hypothetical protein [Dactylosporangium vinaceum]UAB99523.1 hypothetical protein Dvina_16495 [Dactylosporangium vinaceum]